MGLDPIFRRGIHFLQCDFQSRGYWEDFETLAGESDLWVTAYVGRQLMDVRIDYCYPLVRAAWSYLRSNRWGLPRTKWGFNRHVPSDADSTCWAVSLGEALNTQSKPMEKAKNFLRQHIDPNGGVATFSNDYRIRLFTKLRKDISFRGWCGTHSCVTGALLLIPSVVKPETIKFAIQAQKPSGEWTSYWWVTPAYATGLMAEGLRLYSPNHADEAIEKSIDEAVHWARKKLQDSHELSPFEISFLLRTLLVARKPVMNEIDVCKERLFSQQLPDGSWPSSALLQIPPPDVEDPSSYKQWRLNGKGGGSIISDKNRSFTTASVINALAKTYT